MAVFRVAFPSIEVREGTGEVIYVGIVPRVQTAALGVHSGTPSLQLFCISYCLNLILCITESHSPNWITGHDFPSNALIQED